MPFIPLVSQGAFWHVSVKYIGESDIVMTGKPSYEELEQSIKQLEREILEYMRKEQEFNEERNRPYKTIESAGPI